MPRPFRRSGSDVLDTDRVVVHIGHPMPMNRIANTASTMITIVIEATTSGVSLPGFFRCWLIRKPKCRRSARSEPNNRAFQQADKQHSTAAPRPAVFKKNCIKADVERVLCRKNAPSRAELLVQTPISGITIVRAANFWQHQSQ